MATAIDTLVVELALDPTKFTEGQKKAIAALRDLEEQSEKSGKNLQHHTGRLDNLFRRLKTQALGLAASLFGAYEVGQFVANITNLDAAVGRSAKTLNMSTKELSAWQGVARQSGGSSEEMTGALQNLSAEMNKIAIGMPSGIMPMLQLFHLDIRKVNGQLKTAGELMMELARAVDGQDPAYVRTVLSSYGIPESVINTLLLGKQSLEDLYAEQVRLGLISEEDAKRAIALSKSWEQAKQSATTFGRVLLNLLTPALTSFLEYTKRFGQVQYPNSWLGKLLMGAGATPAGQDTRLIGTPAGVAQPQAAWPSSSGTTARATATNMEDYIREQAVARGIDPKVAIAVARSEGLNAYVGDRGSSFGPFQLHYGGVASGGMAVSGLGDKFTRQTGLDARDQSTWKAQVDFALDEAKRSGWGAWHGWKGAARAGLGDTHNNSAVHGNTIIINGATDPQATANAVNDVMQRWGTVSRANWS